VIFRRRRRESELEEEIQAHLRLAEQDRMRQGESPDEAANAARRELGSVTLVKGRRPGRVGLDLVGAGRAGRPVRDRNFARNRGATAIIIFTLAAGIGADTAVFSILDAVLLRQLPYRDPGRLVSILDLQKAREGGDFFRPL